jgi:hypothetical protein
MGVSVVFAQQPEKSDAQAPPDMPEATTRPAEPLDPACRQCHGCDTPRADQLCLLHACTRDGAHRRIAGELARKSPDVVILGELEEAYHPVPFDHKGHAKMAEMTRGCIVCHHCSDQSRGYAACKTCHGIEIEGTDVRTPDLKTAYHLRCGNCHKDWSDETECATCHLSRAGSATGADARAPTLDDLLGRIHPPLSEPSTEVYRAVPKEGAKSVVIFRHWQHVQGFDLGCADCHVEANCTRCHAKEAERRPRTVREHHKPCIRCHGDDMAESTTTIAGRCKRCHWRKGDPKIKAFDHANTGWPLGKYHQWRSCRDCHKEVPFVKQSTDCNGCHEEWEPDSFDHAVTGQLLDAKHTEIDCADCHADRKFDAPPKCDGCHGDEEGFVFPNRRPGPAV